MSKGMKVDAAALRRRERYAMREVRASITANAAARKCGRVRISGNVVVGRNERGGYLGGLATCGQRSCPVCSTRVGQRRAEEVQAAAEKHLASGGHLVMVTFTLPHSAADPLSSSIRALKSAWDSMSRNRGFRKSKVVLGFDHYVKSLEVTYGENGWHPHLHLLLFIKPSNAPAGLVAAAVDGVYAGAWNRALVAADWRETVAGIGVRSTWIDDQRDTALASYVTKLQDQAAVKWGLELARSDLKSAGGTVSAFSVLAALRLQMASSRRRFLVRLWREYENATSGLHVLELSQGFRDEFGLGADESDLEAVETADSGGEVFAVLDVKEWDRVLRARGRSRLLEAADVGAEAVQAVLADIREQRIEHVIGWNANDPAPETDEDQAVWDELRREGDSFEV